MNSFKVVNIHSYLSFALTILFLYQTALNYFIYKQNVINRFYMKSQIGLCLFSTLYTFLNFLLVIKISVPFNLFLLHVMWITGSLSTYFYISAIKGFLNDRSNNLVHIQKLPLISATGAFFCLISWSLTGNILFIDQALPFLDYKNLYMQHIGGMNPSVIVKLLSFFVFIPIIYSSIYFLRLIMKSNSPQRMLAFGIVFTLLAILNDCSISFWDPTYLLPIMFMAYLFEILRMTYSNQLILGKRLSLLSNDLIQTSKLSEAGTHFAVLAHEILNSLFAAMGYLERLKIKMKQKNSEHEATEYISKIEKQLIKIETLSKNVKRYTRKSTDTEMIQASLNQIILDSIETIQMRAFNANILLRYSELEQPLKINCFRDQIIQVITNLINNAIEAITAQSEKWIEIHIDSKGNDKMALISITDSGNGISLGVQEKMWESRFTTKKDIGMGLGLSLCHSIITNHGGEIYLNNSAPNTQFIIKLPLDQA